MTVRDSSTMIKSLIW